MININIDPILFQYGGLSISWHGLCLAVGICITYFIFLHAGKLQNFKQSHLEKMSFWILISGLIFARLLAVIENWEQYFSHPLEIFAIYDGGITVTGGIIGAFFALVLYSRSKQMNLPRLLDLLALSAPLGYFVGRTGCLILGDVYGNPIHGNWGLVYWHLNSALPRELIGVPTFPAPLLFQVGNLILWILFIRISDHHLIQGSKFSFYLLGYGLIRLVGGHWQPGIKLALGLSYYQWIALSLIMMGLISMGYLIVTDKRPDLEPSIIEE